MMALFLRKVRNEVPQASLFVPKIAPLEKRVTMLTALVKPKVYVKRCQESPCFLILWHTSIPCRCDKVVSDFFWVQTFEDFIGGSSHAMRCVDNTSVVILPKQGTIR